jgi:CRISPR-associated protein Csm1
MSLQIFLHGKIQGIEEFLRNASGDFEARAQWITLLSEILPRALLAEFGLSKMLLGSSGGGQFLVVLPEEFRSRAAEFCAGAAAALAERSGGLLRLIFAITENLGEWVDIRKRLLVELLERSGTPAAGSGSSLFAEPVSTQAEPFSEVFRSGAVIGWSPECPAVISERDGKFTWSLGEEIPFADHAAPDDDGSAPASPDALASRSAGRWIWGVLRADVDSFGEMLRKSNTIEEHLQLSMMYKTFVVGELQMRCSLPEFWQKVRVLYAGGQSFAVVGAWDALIGLAREMQRMFALFVDANVRELAGTEGKSVSMALALADDDDATLAGVYGEAGDKLAIAKAAGRDSIWVLGRILEWKQLADAAESRVTMTRLIRDFGVSKQFLDELAAFYSDSSDTIVSPGVRKTNVRVDRPWRFYRRLDAVLGTQARGREFARLRSDLISDFTGRRASNIRLRPQGRVALEWARLETGAI